jgi:hypothetical protein
MLASSRPQSAPRRQRVPMPWRPAGLFTASLAGGCQGQDVHAVRAKPAPVAEQQPVIPQDSATSAPEPAAASADASAGGQPQLDQIRQSIEKQQYYAAPAYVEEARRSGSGGDPLSLRDQARSIRRSLASRGAGKAG